MAERILYAIFLVGTILYFLFYEQCLENKKRLKIQDVVQHCEVENTSELLGCLYQIQELDKMPTECYIGIDKERKIALNILHDFKNDLAFLFF